MNAGALRDLAREFFTGLGAPAATVARQRTAARIRLLVVAPLILMPAAWVYQARLAGARDPASARMIFGAWATAIAAWFLANAVMAALPLRGSPSGRLERFVRALTLLSVAVEIGSNQLSMHAGGTLMSAASLYVVLVVAIYRVFFDYGLALFASVLGCTLYAVFAALEVAGTLPIAPLFPRLIEHPVYSDPTVAATIVQMTVFGTLLAFFAVNYGVNQSVKLHRYITESVLRRYLPPTLVARASRGELQLDAEPERRVVTVMFTDLVGFTSLSERLGADTVGRLLNRYLSRMADVAHAHGATVDKFVGDCVMIVFGAPDPLPPADQARRCVALAVELQQMLPALGGDAPLAARTGINTGEAVVGNFGSMARSDYTVIGPAVNVAARLESNGRPGRILVGEQTAALLDGAVGLEPAGELQLKGVSHPVKAYFICPGPPAASGASRVAAE